MLPGHKICWHQSKKDVRRFLSGELELRTEKEAHGCWSIVSTLFLVQVWPQPDSFNNKSHSLAILSQSSKINDHLRIQKPSIT